MHEPGRRAVLRRARAGNPMCACAKSGPPAAFGLSVRSPEMTVQFPYGSGLPTADGRAAADGILEPVFIRGGTTLRASPARS
jgi:hypothetical protein